jgi:hypothetical protein
MKTKDIKLELKSLIDQETDLNLLETAKALFTQKDFDPAIENEMMSQALKSERNIKDGKVHTIEEADTLLSKRLGL